jgi:hypothetical protein
LPVSGVSDRAAHVDFLAYLANSPFSYWLSTSMAGFPTLIALHSVGMAAAVGLSMAVTLRLCGSLPDLGFAPVPRLLDVAVWGFTLNLVTGLFLFITRGAEYLAAGIFLIKMALVIVGAALTIWLRQRLTPIAPSSPAIADDGLARAVSLVATIAWFAAVVAGRLIAYVSDLYR